MATRSHLPHRRLPFRPVALLALALSILYSCPGELAAQGPPTIVPADESPANPAFHRFWKKFQHAVGQRDGKFILSVISDKIHLSFGGSSGRMEFVSTWKPEDPEGPLWKELDEIVRLGGSLGGGSGLVFSAPYAYGKWPDGFDIFDYVFISGRNVRFRAEPNTKGTIIRNLSWEIMKMIDANSQGSGWAKLEAHDGQTGFVHLDFVRSSVDYRIGFSKNGKGAYKMDFLIAGD